MIKLYVLVDNFWCGDANGSAMRKRGDELEFKTEAEAQHMVIGGMLSKEPPVEPEAPLPLFKDEPAKGKKGE